MKKINELNLSRSFKTLEAIPSGLFSVDVEDIDSKYNNTSSALENTP